MLIFLWIGIFSTQINALFLKYNRGNRPTPSENHPSPNSILPKYVIFSESHPIWAQNNTAIP